MSEISSTYLSQRWDDRILSLMLCVRDGYPNGRRHFSGSVFGGNLLPQKYSPTRRDDFVRCDSSGARPDFSLEKPWIMKTAEVKVVHHNMQGISAG